MPDNRRHFANPSIAWDPDEASNVIVKIVGDALSRFDSKRFWPSHPLEDGLADGNTSFYVGATGMIWALNYLARIRAISGLPDFREVIPHLLDANRSEFARKEYCKHGSFLFGDLGTLLVGMQIARTSNASDLLFARAEANTSLPIRDLMWGMPGSMLACIFASELTGETRWRELYDRQAMRLLAELEETPKGPLWTQDLYGSQHRWLGPIHGYAGNILPLLRGWDWLAEEQRARLAIAIPRTLAENAWRSEIGTTWGAKAENAFMPTLCQYCHGAPGMVATFCEARFISDQLDRLLLEGGTYTWNAGPLVKGPGLCHGTGGNGYAFLKLYRRTGDESWLSRARSFAMVGIEQLREMQAKYGRGRYTLWTGDIGFAIFLRDCLSGQASFPTMDVF